MLSISHPLRVFFFLGCTVRGDQAAFSSVD